MSDEFHITCLKCRSSDVKITPIAEGQNHVDLSCNTCGKAWVSRSRALLYKMRTERARALYKVSPDAGLPVSDGCKS